MHVSGYGCGCGCGCGCAFLFESVCARVCMCACMCMFFTHSNHILSVKLSGMCFVLLLCVSFFLLSPPTYTTHRGQVVAFTGLHRTNCFYSTHTHTHIHKALALLPQVEASHIVWDNTHATYYCLIHSPHMHTRTHVHIHTTCCLIHSPHMHTRTHIHTTCCLIHSPHMHTHTRSIIHNLLPYALKFTNTHTIYTHTQVLSLSVS